MTGPQRREAAIALARELARDLQITHVGPVSLVKSKGVLVTIEIFISDRAIDKSTGLR